MNEMLTVSQVADLLGVTKDTVRRWDSNGTLTSVRDTSSNYRLFPLRNVQQFEQVKMFEFPNKWHQEEKTKPSARYSAIELFAGAGGLALGLEQAGFTSVLLNENDAQACQTLRKNRPSWNVVEGDIATVDFSSYRNQVDLISGGFPCQAFSYAGKKLGFDDIRGTLFFEFARAIKEVQPKIFLGENVRGLLKHDDGKTLKTISDIIKELGYTLVEPKVLKAIFYKVPQKRERLLLVGIRNDLLKRFSFEWPAPFGKILTLEDALKKGILYSSDVPSSVGQSYPKRKKEILKLIPPGGYWRDLPLKTQKEYMQKSFYLGGGKTGMARRLAWNEPSLTLTCSPAQKQTERCHPEETRPLTVREYARIQTFPDEWEFCGSTSAQYKQIGNAVPVNLAAAVARSLIRALNTFSLGTEDIAQTTPL